MCCDCTDGCRDPNLCACLQLQAHDDGSYTNVNVDGGVVPRGVGGIASGPECRGDGKGSREEVGAGRSYSDDGLLLRERRTIFECHSRSGLTVLLCPTIEKYFDSNDHIVSVVVIVMKYEEGKKCNNLTPAASGSRGEDSCKADNQQKPVN